MIQTKLIQVIERKGRHFFERDEAYRNKWKDSTERNMRQKEKANKLIDNNMHNKEKSGVSDSIHTSSFSEMKQQDKVSRIPSHSSVEINPDFPKASELQFDSPPSDNDEYLVLDSIEEGLSPVSSDGHFSSMSSVECYSPVSSDESHISISSDGSDSDIDSHKRSVSHEDKTILDDSKEDKTKSADQRQLKMLIEKLKHLKSIEKE